jgi:hypothetical protein
MEKRKVAEDIQEAARRANEEEDKKNGKGGMVDRFK